MKPQIITIALVILTGVTGTIAARVPAVMNYQGTLTDVAGVPVADGNYTVTFRIYELSEGGAPIWTEMMSTTAPSR